MGARVKIERALSVSVEVGVMAKVVVNDPFFFPPGSGTWPELRFPDPQRQG